MANDNHTQPGEPIRHTAVQLRMAPDPITSAGPPVKGGMKTTGTAAARFEEDIDLGTQRGTRAIYILTRPSDQGDETPVFRVDHEVADSVLVFSNRDLAVLYLQVAGWDQYKLRELSPLELSQWALSLEGDHIRFFMIDENRLRHSRGEGPDHVLDIGAMRDLSGENLMQEIHAAGIK